MKDGIIPDVHSYLLNAEPRAGPSRCRAGQGHRVRGLFYAPRLFFVQNTPPEPSELASRAQSTSTKIGETRNQAQFTFQTTIRLTSCADVLCAPLLNGFCLRCLVYWFTWLPSPQVSNRHLWGVLSGTEERPSHPISGTVGRDRRIAVLRDRPEGS